MCQSSAVWKMEPSDVQCEDCGQKARFDKIIGNRFLSWQCNQCWFKLVSWDLRCTHCVSRELSRDEAAPPKWRKVECMTRCWDDRQWYCQNCWIRWIGPCPQCEPVRLLSPIQCQGYDQERGRHLLFKIMNCLGAQPYNLR